MHIYGVTAEYFINSGEATLQATTNIVNLMFQFGTVTGASKAGALTPVYKKRGSSTDAKNYRGITVLPVMTKIIESVLRNQIQPYVEQQQNSLQQGFTKHSPPPPTHTPMNCSLIMEEVVRDRKDSGRPVFTVFLDVKSAFDVVPHDSLLRRLYHTGVEGRTVSDSLTTQWSQVCDQMAGEFTRSHSRSRSETWGYHEYRPVQSHGNTLLDRIEGTGRGCYSGDICCAAPTCADDMLVLTDAEEVMHFLFNIAVDNRIMENYLLQPVKSALLCILNAIT